MNLLHRLRPQRFDQRTDVVGDLFAAFRAVVGVRAGAAFDGPRQQRPAGFDPAGQLFDRVALGGVRPAFGPQRGKRDVDVGAAVPVGSEMGRIARQDEAPHARLGIEQMHQQAVEMGDAARLLLQFLQRVAAGFGMVLRGHQPDCPQYETEHQYHQQKQGGCARQAGRQAGQEASRQVACRIVEML